MSMSDVQLTRDGVCRTFGITEEALRALEEAGILAPNAENLFDILDVAAATFRFGMNRAIMADAKLAAVAAALQGVLPALERLSALPHQAGLDGDAHERATAEVAAFISAFAALLTRANEALSSQGQSEPRASRQA